MDNTIKNDCRFMSSLLSNAEILIPKKLHKYFILTEVDTSSILLFLYFKQKISVSNGKPCLVKYYCTYTMAEGIIFIGRFIWVPARLATYDFFHP